VDSLCLDAVLIFSIAFIEKMLALDEAKRYRIVTCGEETHLAYNRVRNVLLVVIIRLTRSSGGPDRILVRRELVVYLRLNHFAANTAPLSNFTSIRLRGTPSKTPIDSFFMSESKSRSSITKTAALKQARAVPFRCVHRTFD
jgi:hypothetical protein